MMQRREIPGTGIQVSALCLGTMNFGQQVDEAGAHAQLDFAVEHGIDFFDAAEVYPIPPDREKQGLTETYIGTWLKKRGNRDSVVLASKVASRNQSATIRTRDAKSGLIRKSILDAIDGTLLRLQTDHVDLYQVHSPDRHTNYFGVRGVESLDNDDGASIEETLESLADVVKSGKARAVGISNETPWGVSHYLRIAKERGFPKIATIQNQYSLLNRTFEVGLSEMCLRENIGLLPYSVLNMGVLTGKYLGGKKPDGARFTRWERNSSRYNPANAQEAAAAYVALAAKYNITPSQLAIAFTLSRPFVTSVIIAATNIEQLHDDIGASDVQLGNELMDEIRQIYVRHPDPTC